MATASSNHNTTITTPAYDHQTLPTNTTFVQADPSTFRAVVQQLTGAPLTARLAGKSPSVAGGDMGPRRPPFKLLHERRQRKLEIKLNQGGYPFGSMVSPVSTLDGFGRGSPRTPPSPEEEAAEERAIAEKGFYLHRSPMSTPRGGPEPELLPLFPLHSPRD